MAFSIVFIIITLSSRLSCYNDAMSVYVLHHNRQLYINNRLFSNNPQIHITSFSSIHFVIVYFNNRLFFIHNASL